MTGCRSGWKLRSIGKKKEFWILVFSLMFFLSMDFWNWGSDKLLAGFLPIWVLRIIVIQWILSLLFLSFYKIYGGEDT